MPVGFADRISSSYVDYRTELGFPPVLDHEVFATGLSLSAYQNRLLYLETAPALKAVHGFDAKLETVPRKLVISLGDNP